MYFGERSTLHKSLFHELILKNCLVSENGLRIENVEAAELNIKLNKILKYKNNIKFSDEFCDIISVIPQENATPVWRFYSWFYICYMFRFS